MKHLNKAIVTGGAGFIGSAVCELLSRRLDKIIVFDNFSTGSLRNIEGLVSSGKLQVVEGDVSSSAIVAEKLEPLARRSEVSAIVHLAAIVSVEEAYRDPKRTLEVNVIGTLNVLELARRLDVERIVYASSVAVYGEPKYLPIDEEHPLDPANLYGVSKLMGEMILWRYMEDYGLKPIALRLFNVYGPRMRRGPYSGVIYKFIASLLAGESPTIYGDGMQTRDFVYVYDAAEAFEKALFSNCTGPVNIGTGVETTIRELYETICSIIGKCPKPRYAPPRRGDVRRSAANISKAWKELRWRPRTTFLKGLEETINYYRRLQALDRVTG